MTYSAAGTALQTVELLSDVHHYLIEVTEAAEYTVSVAATTRHGSGLVRSRTGEVNSILSANTVNEHVIDIHFTEACEN